MKDEEFGGAHCTQSKKKVNAHNILIWKQKEEAVGKPRRW
jgi:hypothetical protein